MADIVIKQEESKPEPKVEVEDIKKTLREADEYQKLKEQNDKLEAEYLRSHEIRAKMALGGRADAGMPEKSDKEKADEAASEILEKFG